MTRRNYLPGFSIAIVGVFTVLYGSPSLSAQSLEPNYEIHEALRKNRAERLQKQIDRGVSPTMLERFKDRNEPARQLTPEEEAKLKSLLQKRDLNGNGKIDVEELNSEAAVKEREARLRKEFEKKELQFFDINKDGVISFEERKLIAEKKEQIFKINRTRSEAERRRTPWESYLIEEFDKDKDGDLSEAEIHKFHEHLKTEATNKEDSEKEVSKPTAKP